MNEVQKFRQVKEITPLILDKLLKSQLEVSTLTTRNIYCPYCGYMIEKVYSDISGHKEVYCQKCKQKYVINLGYFRRQKYLPYFKVTFPDKNKMVR
ncbi:MAG: hypothetical protein J5590_04180 [Clostridia bacterium]|nr:hypothetical protein [Clostridia bacterium]